MGWYLGSYHISSLPRRKMCRFLVTMAAVFFIYLLAAGDSSLHQLWYRSRQISALRSELDDLRAENAKLKEELALLNDDLSVIERIARERYGMVKGKESVYMVYPHLPEDLRKGGR